MATCNGGYNDYSTFEESKYSRHRFFPVSISLWIIQAHDGALEERRLAPLRSKETPMRIPTWTKPAITGAIVGAVATMALGFTQGGWYTNNSAEHLAYQRSAAAVIEALIPICVSQSKVDPDSMNKLEELVAMKSSYAQRDFVMKTGWATMPSADEPDRDLAAACAEALSKPAQS